MIEELKQLQKELATALRKQGIRKSELETAELEYQKELAKWQEGNPLFARVESTKKETAVASEEVASLREKAKSMLQVDFMPDLPEGFKQVREKFLEYDSDTLLAVAVERAPFLLTLNNKVVNDFFMKLAVEQPDKTFAIPDYIKRWYPVKIAVKPKANISDKTLKKVGTEAVSNVATM